MPACVTCSRELSASVSFCPHCGTPNPEAPTMTPPDAVAATELMPPDVLKQQVQAALGPEYLVDYELGEGGFAHVFAVTDRKLSRRIAVKVLRPEFTGSRSSVQRFIREAESAAKLNHPNILPIFFVGEGQGLVYFGMPLVEGETLDAKLRREGAQPEVEVARIGAEIAEALHEAHAHSLVHRDVKPANVMLQGPKQRVLVADFGIAKAAAGSGEKLTGTGVIIGSPHYMSPEQASGAPDVDRRSDIYSLGVVLWEMLAGEVPFDGPSSQGILIQHLTKAMPPVRTKRPTVSAQLSKVVARCTEKKPDDRYQTAAELAEELRAAVAASGARPARDRRPWVLGGMIAAAVVVVAVAAIGAWRLLGPAGQGGAGSDAPGAGGGTKIAVLPFEALAGTEGALFGRQAAQLLADAVGTRFGVPTVDNRDLLGRWASESRRVEAPIAENADFARGLGASQMVVGTAVEAGRQLRLSVNVYDTRSAVSLARGEVTGDKDSLFALIDQLAGRVAGGLCAQPDFNPNNLCFETPPRPAAPIEVAAGGSSGPLSFYVRVSKAGGVSEVRPAAGAGGAADSAVALARAALEGAQYVPARKAGAEVEAWAVVNVAISRR